MYKIIRRYSRIPQVGEGPHLITWRRTIASGLTLQEAQKHCSNPQTSYRTATGIYANKMKKQGIEWGDGYTET